MKKLLMFLLCLFFPLFAMADVIIPFTAFMGSNFFVTGNIVFGLGLFLLLIVWFIESAYFNSKITNPPKRLGGLILLANIISTILGGILLIFISDLFFKPSKNFFLLKATIYQIICFILSWVIEYFCLKDKIKDKKLLKITFNANLLSYVVLTIVNALFVSTLPSVFLYGK